MEQNNQQVMLIERINKVLKILSRSKFIISDEKALQTAIKIKLDANYISNEREYHLDPKNILDFYIPGGIAIEVKIKESSMAIYRQCQRYCNFDEVKSLLLITNRSTGFPKMINGKPCYVINMGKAWL